MKRFLDSNIFLYAYSANAKTPIAQAEIAKGGYASVQVFSETANIMRNKMRRSWEEVEEKLAFMEELVEEILPLTRALQKKAFLLAKSHQLNIYDSLIIAAALQANCDELLSEDMQHGRRFDGLVIRNPFLGAAH